MSKNIIAKSYPRLKRIVWLQRSLRIVIRAGWLGMSGWLVAWSLSTIFSLNFSSNQWFLVTAVIFFISLVFILFRKPSLYKLTWTFDRLFGLKEQFSTGYQLTKEETQSTIHKALLSEVDKLSAPHILKIKKKGWRLYPDILSLIIVVALFYLVYQVEFFQTDLLNIDPSSERIKLSPLGSDPSLLNLFQIQQEKYDEEQEDEQEQETGDYQIPANSGGGSGAGFGEQNSSQNASSNPNNQLLDALTKSMQELGNQLNFDAGTYEISQGLMSADMEEMASAVEKLANQLSQMSKENLQQISEILNELAENLEENGLQETSEQMMEAATSIEQAIKSQSSKNSTNNNPNDPNNVAAIDDEIVNAQESLDQVAKSLREISQQNYSLSRKGGADGAPSNFDNGMVISNQETSAPKELTRLTSEADTFEFLSSDQPGDPIAGFPHSSATISKPANITQSSFSVSDDYYIDYIVPYYYPWMWHNVVSKYFERD